VLGAGALHVEPHVAHSRSYPGCTQPTQRTQSGSPLIASGPAGRPMTRWVTSLDPHVGHVPRGTSYGSKEAPSPSPGGSVMKVTLPKATDRNGPN